MANVTAKAVEANDLLARITGRYTGAVVDSEEPAGVEIEFEDEPKKATTKKKSTRTKKVETPKRVDRVPDLDMFAKLNRNVTIKVSQNQHDIHYKEQVWGIPRREITYNLEVVTNPKVAKDVAMLFGDKSPEALKSAEEGLVRYLKVISYENIPYRSREIGYIKVTANEAGKLSSKILVKAQQMKENNINPDKVKKQLEDSRDKLLGRVS